MLSSLTSRVLLVAGLGGDERGLTNTARKCAETQEVYALVLDENHPSDCSSCETFPASIEVEAARLIKMVTNAFCVEPSNDKPMFSCAMGTSLGAAVILHAYVQYPLVAQKVVLDSPPLFAKSAMFSRALAAMLKRQRILALTQPDKLRMEAEGSSERVG